MHVQRRRRKHHVELVLLALPFEEAHLLGNDARYVDQLGLEEQVALFQPLGVQEVVEEIREPAALTVDDLEITAAAPPVPPLG